MNEKRQKLIETYYNNKIETVEIMVDNVENFHDVAAIARTADGFGIKTICLYYTHCSFPNVNREGKKSSASANKWILFEEIHHLQNFVDEKKKQDYKFIGIFGTKTLDESKLLWNYSFPKKCMLIINPTSKELVKECDVFLHPPITEQAEYSLSIYTAMTLYEVFSQHGKHLSQQNLLSKRGRDS